MNRLIATTVIILAALMAGGCMAGGQKAAQQRFELSFLLDKQLEAEQNASAQDRANSMVDAAESLNRISANFKAMLADDIDGWTRQAAFEEYEAARADVAAQRDREWMVRTERIEALGTVRYGVKTLSGMFDDIEAANNRLKAAAFGEATKTAAHGVQLIQERQAAKEAARAAEAAEKAARKAAEAEAHSNAHSHTPPPGE